MKTSSIYPYTARYDNGYMLHFVFGPLNLFRFFKDTTYGSMDNANEAANEALIAFNDEYKVNTEDTAFYVRQVIRSVGLPGLFMLVKGTSIVGFGVKNGNTSMVRFTFGYYNPEECWERVVKLRSMYDPTIDLNTPIPDAIRSKISFSKDKDVESLQLNSITALFQRRG